MEDSIFFLIRVKLYQKRCWLTKVHINKRKIEMNKPKEEHENGKKENQKLRQREST